jgi:hypothetical protein
MDDADDFTLALAALDFAADVNHEITDVHQISTLRRLYRLNEDGLENMVKAIQKSDDIEVFPQYSIMQLQAMHYWVVDQVRHLDNEPAPGDFIGDIVDEYIEKYQVDARRRRDGTEAQPLMPDKFKEARTFPMFKESLTTYLSQIRGVSGVPLNYIV